MARKVHSRGPGEGLNHLDLPVDCFKEPTLIDKRSRKVSGYTLTVADKIRIVHQVLCQYQKQADVAREYRVTASYISRIVKTA